MSLKSTHDQDEVIARRKPKTRRPSARKVLESDILQQVRNAIGDTLLLHAPESWADSRLNQIEKLVLKSAKANLTASTDDELRSNKALEGAITQAVAKTRSLIQSWQSSLDKWAFPDDPALTTLPIILTLDNEDWAIIDATIQKLCRVLKDREDFVNKAVLYTLACLGEEAAADRPKRKGRKK
jgi:hypothetical protein